MIMFAPPRSDFHVVLIIKSGLCKICQKNDSHSRNRPTNSMKNFVGRGLCVTIVVGEGKIGRAAFLPHLQGSVDCPVPLPKAVRRAKVSREQYQRRGCATNVYRFWKLHLGRCDKDSARPVLPFLTDLLSAFGTLKDFTEMAFLYFLRSPCIFLST